MAFHVHRSNRLERLAETLAGVVRAPLADPFARECIVVQGPGMERWLATYLARELGIWANPWFPFPRTLIELFLAALLGPTPDLAPSFTPEALTWRIAAELPKLLERPSFREVTGYLAHDREHGRLLDLSQKLADRFDQYIVYRPELVLGWERGEELSSFQAELFRRLSECQPATHLAARMRELERALERGEVLVGGRDGVPERVSLFGISTLPPTFLALLARVAEFVDVHLFLLTPSRHYFGDLDRSESRRGDLWGFLAQLGKVSREFIDAIEKTSYLEAEDDAFVSPGHGSMLSALQSDLVELVAREQRGHGESAPLPIPQSDDSLRVHVCHSLVRELEVLRDQLRARFERDVSLEPRDVIVFTPDIERYAPAIEAVFGEGGKDERGIPFRIADRRTLRASEVAEAFFAALELASSRLSLSQVLDFLHRAAVRDRFEIAERELDRVQDWLADAGARWAMDGAHRAQFDQPAFHQNSLQFALERLLLGYAAPDGESRELFGVLPFAAAEGHEALLLGKLAHFLETLFVQVRGLSAPLTPSASAVTLSALLEALISSEGELGIEHNLVRSALSELALEAERASFTSPVSLQSFSRLLEQRLERGRVNLGFLAGGVTFCEPVPMRAIPFRVVCLLGMDDESFPRSADPPAFDLLRERPRPGDRSVRDDDRQLFLEALLSARETLHISYVGKSAQDESERPASVLVDQLLRLCEQHFVFASPSQTLSLGLEGTLSEVVRIEHGLHRFDPRYFRRASHPHYFSYDASALAAASAAQQPKQRESPFAGAPLPVVDPAPSLTLETLGRFFRYPQELFLRERLKIVLPRGLDEVDDREPLVLDALERFRIADDLIEQRDALPDAERERLLRGAGRLGPGSLGKAQLARLEGLVQEVLAACPDAPETPDRSFTLTLPSGQLTGRLRGLRQDERLARSVGALHVKRQLGAWIEHLVLCATGAAPRRTRLVGRDSRGNAEVLLFTEVEEPHILLDELLQLYRVGMCMPLPLIHAGAEAYLKASARGDDTRRALLRAQAALASAPVGRKSALEDPHLLQAFGREQLGRLDLLSASDGQQTVSFIEVSERVLGPMLRHSQKDRKDE